MHRVGMICLLYGGLKSVDTRTEITLCNGPTNGGASTMRSDLAKGYMNDFMLILT